jgi:uncharacterized protein (DUF1800 family)
MNVAVSCTPAPLIFSDAQTDSTSLSRSAVSSVAISALATAALSACGGGGGGDDAPFVSTPIPGRIVSLSSGGYAYTSPTTDEQAARFLQQAQFAATEADIASVRSLGYAGWLEAQVAKAYTTGWDWLTGQGYGNVFSSNNYFDQSYPADYMVWSQLMDAPDVLRKRVALALSEIFVVSLVGVSATWRSYIMAHYWDTLCLHALGNYRDLLQAMTLNVGMGYYLNTKGNLKENSAGRQPDENYAREVMQLLSIGLVQLNADGTVQLDGSGATIDTYNASDVSNLARVFTGYDVDQSQNVPTTIAQTGGGTRTVSNTAFARLPMKLNAANHSTLAASFLGTTIPANTDATVALGIALDTLFNHPNTAPFICKQLIQRLVTSNPSAPYVGRVAAVFANNGAGIRGDLASVFSAILRDDEARSPAALSDPEFGKLREPMVRLVQWARTFGVRSVSGAWKIGDLSNPGTQLGQSPLRAPSVFNYFRPGYVHPSTTLSVGKVAPEFQIVNESSVGGYLNYLMTVIDGGIASGDIKAAYTIELTLVLNPAALVNRLNLLLCAGQLVSATRTLITNTLSATAVTAASSEAIKRNRVCAAVLMVMACSEYLVQK